MQSHWLLAFLLFVPFTASAEDLGNVRLQTYGCPPPPPDYFTPTREEIDEGMESILRRVTHPR